MSATLEEHVGYISDSVRMEIFRQAVAKAIRPGDVVLDLGCGFGPLGLLCLQAGAERVYGIDRTIAIELARESAARAGFADRYICIRDHSFRVNLPEKADVLICDHVGFFGFDYGIVPIMADAVRRMLKPSGRVIPGRITLMVAGVNTAKCRAKAFAWTAPAIPAEFRWLEDYAINSKHTHFYDPDDVLTSEGRLGEIDLASVNPDHVRFNADLVAQSDCDLDGLGGWFDCEIAAGISMTNSPLAARRISREQVFLAFDRQLPVRSGDIIRITLTLRFDVSMFGWTAHNLNSGERRRQSTWASQILSEADRAVAAPRPVALSSCGRASRAVLALIDGIRSPREIEDLILTQHPDLFPSESETRKFVQSELTRYTD